MSNYSPTLKPHMTRQNYMPDFIYVYVWPPYMKDPPLYYTVTPEKGQPEKYVFSHWHEYQQRIACYSKEPTDVLHTP